MGIDFGKQMGPLPLGAWVAVVGGGVGIALYTRHMSSSASTTATPTTTTSGHNYGMSGGGSSLGVRYPYQPYRPDPRSTVKPDIPGEFYTTHSHDTLRKISNWYYGSDSYWKDIFQVNHTGKQLPNGQRGKLSNPLILPTGVNIWLPPKGQLHGGKHHKPSHHAGHK